jgi:hypothetical protein
VVAMWEKEVKNSSKNKRLVIMVPYSRYRGPGSYEFLYLKMMGPVVLNG